MRGIVGWGWRAVLLAASLALPGCDTIGSAQKLVLGDGADQGASFVGAVAADEPRAAAVARDVLAAGGTAADAAAALGLALSVTLPSRASLGAGGACLAYDPDADAPGGGVPQAVLFTPEPGGAGGRRPAGLPMLARGLFALQTHDGHLAFDALIAPAEQMARQGVGTSRALARDLAAVAGPLLADPAARAVFAPSGQVLAEGAMLRQPDLAATLSRLRINGVGALYQGPFAESFASAANGAGGGIATATLRAALPRWAAPVMVDAGPVSAAFLPGDGGQAAADFRALQRGTAPGTPSGRRPASTGFTVLDRQGRAVACAISMDNLFGTGRIAPGTGILLAASPKTVPAPLLSAAIAWSKADQAFHAAVSGSGQGAAALAAAEGVWNALRTGQPMPQPVPDPGRANVITCPGGVPGGRQSCAAATDPRGAGLALGNP